MSIESQYGAEVAALDRQFSQVHRTYLGSESVRERERLLAKALAIVAEMRRQIKQARAAATIYR